MKVKLKHAVRVKRGDDHEVLESGSEVDLAKDVAQHLINKGAAESIGKAPAPKANEDPGAEPE